MVDVVERAEAHQAADRIAVRHYEAADEHLARLVEGLEQAVEQVVLHIADPRPGRSSGRTTLEQGVPDEVVQADLADAWKILDHLRWRELYLRYRVLEAARRTGMTWAAIGERIGLDGKNPRGAAHETHRRLRSGLAGGPLVAAVTRAELKQQRRDALRAASARRAATDAYLVERRAEAADALARAGEVAEFVARLVALVVVPEVAADGDLVDELAELEKAAGADAGYPTEVVMARLRTAVDSLAALDPLPAVVAELVAVGRARFPRRRLDGALVR